MRLFIHSEVFHSLRETRAFAADGTGAHFWVFISSRASVVVAVESVVARIMFYVDFESKGYIQLKVKRPPMRREFFSLALEGSLPRRVLRKRGWRLCGLF